MPISNFNDLIINILDSIPDGIFISDPEGVALHINTMYEQITGLNAQDIIGKNINTLVKNGIFDKIVNPEVIESQQSQTLVQQLKNGKKVVLTGVPVFDDKGQVYLVATFVRDITAISRLNEQMDEQSKLIEHFQDQMLLISKQGIHEADSVFTSEPIIKVKKFLEKVASTDATILLLGQTGVGKDVFAKYTHAKSKRNSAMFFKVDCGVISETLIESEMFGYMPGAFTGASNKGKAGYFELANGGTIFLDEVGELPLSTQTRLLRVLQDGEIMRLGDSKARKVDVRIIAATNKDLVECVHNGTFRSDLYYRLNVASIKIPALCERVDDIEPIACHYLQVYANKYQKTLSFSDSTLDILKKYHWPGNVRELQNMLHSVVITSTNLTVRPKDLPTHLQSYSLEGKEYSDEVKGNGKNFKEVMADMEKNFLKEAIEYHGSIQKVANIFKIDRSTIFRKLNS